MHKASRFTLHSPLNTCKHMPECRSQTRMLPSNEPLTITLASNYGQKCTA